MTAVRDVSVVMGVYNTARYLRTAIDSVLAQQGVGFEFIIVDDGSTDESPRIIAEASARDARVRVITQENVGLTQALIRGCAAARGRYIARQDGDDFSMPERLRLQSEMLDADPSLVFVSCWAEVIGPEDEPLMIHRRPGTAQAATELLVRGRSGPPGHGSVMFRRDAYERIGGYRPLFYYAQDSDLWLRLATVGQLNYVQRILYCYRISAESMSGQLHAAKLPYARLIDDLHSARQRKESEQPILDRFIPPEKTGARQPSSEDATHYFIARCLVNRRDRRALGYLRRCLRSNPLNFRGWLLLPYVALTGPFWSRPGDSIS
jgi:hypothetical protein